MTISKNTTPSPLVVQPGDGEAFAMTPVEHLLWKATADNTGGVFDCFEAFMHPGVPGAPEHIHDTADELLYILEGEFYFKIGDNLFPAKAGTFVFIPKGTPHTWINTHTDISRMLVQFLPGGMQGFFEATSPLVQANPVNIPLLIEAAGRFDTRVVGPPLTPETMVIHG